MKALIVGKRSALLEALKGALTERGHQVTMVAVGADVMAESRYDVVAFGHRVDDVRRRAVMDVVRSRQPRAQRVDGLALIPELLVAQCEWAGRRASGEASGDPAVSIEAVPVPRVAVRRVGGTSQVRVIRHRRSLLGVSTSEPLVVDVDGTDAVAYFARRPSSNRDFVSVRIDGAAVFVGDSLGRLPLCQ